MSALRFFAFPLLFLLVTSTRTIKRKRQASRQSVSLHGSGLSIADPDGDNDEVVNKTSPPGAQVPWVSKGNRVMKRADETIVSTGAGPEDYELVALGVSSGGGADGQPQDGDFLASQGFQLIGAEGTYDQKIELWIRKNEGRGPITVCQPCGLWSQTAIDMGGLGAGWGVVKIDGAAAQLNLGSIEKASWQGRHWFSRVWLSRPSSRVGLGILAIFFDDPTAIGQASGGDLAVAKWGWGDGDGIGLIVWQPGQSLPLSMPVTANEFGGMQYAAITANIAVS